MNPFLWLLLAEKILQALREIFQTPPKRLTPPYPVAKRTGKRVKGEPPAAPPVA